MVAIPSSIEHLPLFQITTITRTERIARELGCNDEAEMFSGGRAIKNKILAGVNVEYDKLNR
jgi:hypothetical protein